ncbi:MAG: hypothetical protein OWU84_14095 [Firmicutes bacterium]|nr:hypothetical protein [Bacillota bacterium]
MDRPTVLAATLRLPNRCPGADAAQIFQRDAASDALGFRHHPLTDHVGHIRRKAEFFFTPACCAP